MPLDVARYATSLRITPAAPSYSAAPQPAPLPPQQTRPVPPPHTIPREGIAMEEEEDDGAFGRVGSHALHAPRVRTNCRRFQCRYPNCMKMYASTDAVRKHCRKHHPHWLVRLEQLAAQEGNSIPKPSLYSRSLTR